MSERRRLVHGKQFDYFVCDVHGWDFDESEVDDVCPVCRGEQMERERIIKLLEEHYEKWLSREGSIPDGTVLEFARLARVSTMEFLIRLVKAEAWEEGYAAGDADALTDSRLDRNNPFLEEKQ